MTHPSESRPPRCFVHIGLQKTGTSYLQAVFWQSQDALAAHGLRMLPDSKATTFALMQAVRERRDADPRRLASLTAELRGGLEHDPSATHLVTEESLAPATADQAARFVEHLAGAEVHLVVTVRDLARQLPSVWQQKLSARKTYTFEEFLEAVVARDGRAREFWDSQDLPAVLDRWSRAVPPERVHVVTVPRAGSPPGVLLERYCRVLGIDPRVVDPEVPRANASLGRAQAELLRRVNLALGDRLAGREPNRPVKLYLAKRVLAGQRGRPTRAPARLAAWCRQVADEHVAAVREGGYDVVGDLDDLVPADASFTEEDQAVTEREVNDAATEALATMLVDRHRAALRRRRRVGRPRVSRPRRLLQRIRGR